MQIYHFIINKINWKGSALPSLKFFFFALKIFVVWKEKEEQKVISELLKNPAEF